VRKSVFLCRIQFLILAIAFCASACDVHHYPNFKGRELKPGDPDYPPVNPHPTHVVQFTAVMPPSISTEFILRYEVAYVTRNNKDGSLLAYEGPPGCRWKPTDEFFLNIPMKLEKTGDIYRGSFALDQFQPGSCGWRFAVMLSPMLRTPAVTYRDDYNGGLGDQADNSGEIWCTHKRKVPPQMDATHDKTNQVTDCADLGFVTGYIESAKEFWQSFPLRQRTAGWRGFIAGHARSITIEFHDIDPIYADFEKTHEQR
jgi:hypothetical protein